MVIAVRYPLWILSLFLLESTSLGNGCVENVGCVAVHAFIRYRMPISIYVFGRMTRSPDLHGDSALSFQGNEQRIQTRLNQAMCGHRS